MMEFTDAKRSANLLAAVGEQTRLLIMYRLAEGPHHVGQLADLLDVPIVNMSHHLGVMRQAGLLEDEKDGRRVVYKFRPEVFSPANGDTDCLGTLTLGVCKLEIRRADAVGTAPDEVKVGRRRGRSKAAE
jgi:DNA-binding transcriptional ArsR family regulator